MTIFCAVHGRHAHSRTQARTHAHTGTRTNSLLQHPGETVYVPRGWWHVVITTAGPAVGVTENFLCARGFADARGAFAAADAGGAAAWAARLPPAMRARADA